MRRSKQQSKDVLDWYKKRYPKSVRPEVMQLPEEVKLIQEASVIFQNLAKNDKQQLTIKQLHDICLKSGMNINENQVKMLFEKVDRDGSNSIDLEEFKKTMVDKDFNEEFTKVAMKIRPYMKGTYLPIYYKDMVSHLSFCSNREELRQSAENTNNTHKQRLNRMKSMMKLQYRDGDVNDGEQSRKQSPKKVLRQLSELKNEFEGPKMDEDIGAFITQMEGQINKTKQLQVGQKRKKRVISLTSHIPKIPSLPFIDKHTCWYKQLDVIDLKVKEKFASIDSLYSKQLKTLKQLKDDAYRYVDKAKNKYQINLNHDQVNEGPITIADGKGSGGRSFEEGIVSIIRQQPSIYYDNLQNSISIIKKDEPSVIEPYGDHIPSLMLKKLQQYKSMTRDSSQILAEKSILSTQSKNQSRLITPYNYKHSFQTNTEVNSTKDLTIPQKKQRTLSQQELLGITPNFKISQQHLPYLF